MFVPPSNYFEKRASNEVSDIGKFLKSPREKMQDGKKIDSTGDVQDRNKSCAKSTNTDSNKAHNKEDNRTMNTSLKDLVVSTSILNVSEASIVDSEAPVQLTACKQNFNLLNYKSPKKRDLRLDGAFKIVQLSTSAPAFVNELSGTTIDVDDVLFNFTKENQDHRGRVLGTQTTLVLSCRNRGQPFCVKFHSTASEIEKEAANLLLLKNSGVPVTTIFFKGVSQSGFLCVGMELLSCTLETVAPFKSSPEGPWAECWQACFDILAALHSRDLVHGDSGARNFMHSPAQRCWVVIDTATVQPCAGERRPLPSGACRTLLAQRHDLAMLYHSLLALGTRSRNIYRLLPDAHHRLEAAGCLGWTGELLLPCCTCQGLWACDRVCKRVPLPPAVSPRDALRPANLRRVIAVVLGQDPAVAAAPCAPKAASAGGAQPAAGDGQAPPLVPPPESGPPLRMHSVAAVAGANGTTSAVSADLVTGTCSSVGSGAAAAAAAETAAASVPAGPSPLLMESAQPQNQAGVEYPSSCCGPEGAAGAADGLQGGLDMLCRLKAAGGEERRREQTAAAALNCSAEAAVAAAPKAARDEEPVSC